MIARNTHLALATAIMLAASCAGEPRDASSGMTADTAGAASATPPASSDTIARSTATQCGLPQPLQCADRVYLAFFEETAASLVPGYRLPAARDFGEYWSAFGSFIYKTRDDSDSTKAPYWTRGDFNNDGTTDFAYILIRNTDGAMVLFAFVSSADGYNVITLDDDIEQEMGLATQGQGSFTTAAGKGYWAPTPEDPGVVHVAKHAIAFFMFESAASLFVWDTSKQAFVRVWMSD